MEDLFFWFDRFFSTAQSCGLTNLVVTKKVTRNSRRVRHLWFISFLRFILKSKKIIIIFSRKKTKLTWCIYQTKKYFLQVYDQCVLLRFSDQHLQLLLICSSCEKAIDQLKQSNKEHLLRISCCLYKIHHN